MERGQSHTNIHEDRGRHQNLASPPSQSASGLHERYRDTRVVGLVEAALMGARRVEDDAWPQQLLRRGTHSARRIWRRCCARDRSRDVMSPPTLSFFARCRAPTR